MSKPLTLKEIGKSVVIGIVKGIVYYIVFYVIVIGLLIYYLTPYLVSALGANEGIDINSLSNIVEYRPLNYNVLILFIILSVASSILRRNIPYGSAIASFFGFAMLYIILVNLGFGKFTGVLGEYEYAVDLSPLIIKLLYISLIFTIAGAILSIRNEYIKRCKKALFN